MAIAINRRSAVSSPARSSRRNRVAGSEAVSPNSSSAWSMVSSTVASGCPAASARSRARFTSTRPSTGCWVAARSSSARIDLQSRARSCALNAAASDMASSSSGSSCGRNGGTGNHCAGCLRSRGMTPARASEDLPLPEAPSSSTSGGASRPWRRSASRVSTRLVDVETAPKEDRGVGFLKGHEARIGRSLGIPVEDVERIQPALQQAGLQPPIALLWLGGEVDVLDIAEDLARVAGLRP